jgi:hypothetical protein
MSYFEDQEECWAANNYKGRLEDYDPYDADNWPGSHRSPAPSEEEIGLLKKLEGLADGKGLKCSVHGSGHFQIRAGHKVVNWYPYSKKQTGYESASGEKRAHVSIEQAVAWALEVTQ